MMLGAKTPAQATLVLFTATILLIFVAIFTFNTRSTPNEKTELDDLSDQEIRELIRRGSDTEHLSPETREELKKRNIEI